jgi:hypothetical protein
MTAHLQTQSIEETAPMISARIEDWLLHSGIQIDDGAQRGGIAGWLDADGMPEFVYPEIAGYYLTTMAWLAAGAASSPEHVATARFRAQRAVGWITDVLSSPAGPLTRIYLPERRSDWRNDAIFSFDLAMAARGVGTIGHAAGRRARRQALAALCARMDRISSGSNIMRSHELVDSTATVPDRWSTLPGPHHLKAAAAVLRIGKRAAGNPLTATAHRTCVHWANPLSAGEWPCDELHALLYGLEGMLICDAGTGERLDEVALAFTRLMEVQSTDGTLPETISGGIVRSDVLAQALRVGLLIRGRGRLGGPTWADRLDALAHALAGFVRADGGVLFAMNQDRANTWCAMFAHQALYLHARRGARHPVPPAAFQLLV